VQPNAATRAEGRALKARPSVFFGGRSRPLTKMEPAHARRQVESNIKLCGSSLSLRWR